MYQNDVAAAAASRFTQMRIAASKGCVAVPEYVEAPPSIAFNNVDLPAACTAIVVPLSVQSVACTSKVVTPETQRPSLVASTAAADSLPSYAMLATTLQVLTADVHKLKVAKSQVLDAVRVSTLVAGASETITRNDSHTLADTKQLTPNKKSAGSKLKLDKKKTQVAKEKTTDTTLQSTSDMKAGNTMQVGVSTVMLLFSIFSCTHTLTPVIWLQQVSGLADVQDANTCHKDSNTVEISEITSTDEYWAVSFKSTLGQSATSPTVHLATSFLCLVRALAIFCVF